MEREIYIIRHGQTEYNRLGIIQGRGVDTSLNEVGRQQARSFYEHYKNFPFKKIYTSSLKRSQETVSGFAQSGFPIASFSELDEINWGIYEGKPADKSIKQEYYQITHAWRSGKLDKKAPEGESPLELQQRQQAFLGNLLNNSDENCVLLSIHGRAMRAMLCTLLGKSLTLMDDFPHHNLSLYKIRMGKGHLSKVELFNDLSHLPPGLSERKAGWKQWYGKN